MFGNKYSVSPLVFIILAISACELAPLNGPDPGKNMVKGTVVDAFTRQPIPGIEVGLFTGFSSSGFGFLGNSNTAYTNSCITDTKGRFYGSLPYFRESYYASVGLLKSVYQLEKSTDYRSTLVSLRSNDKLTIPDWVNLEAYFAARLKVKIEESAIKPELRHIGIAIQDISNGQFNYPFIFIPLNEKRDTSLWVPSKLNLGIRISYYGVPDSLYYTKDFFINPDWRKPGTELILN